MPNGHQFEHLPLLLRYRGRAKLRGGGSTSPQTIANRNARGAHSTSLRSAASSLTATWRAQEARRQAENLPVLPAGKPILVQVDPGLDLDVLREKFDFEIVAEQEEGFVLVASKDIDLTEFTRMVTNFAVQVHGSATIAQVHKLYDDPNQTDRVQRVLSEGLFALWPRIPDDRLFVVDVSVACTGTMEIPDEPKRGKRDSDVDWARKQADWATLRSEAYEVWEQICDERQTELIAFAQGYNAEVMLHDDMALDEVFDAEALWAPARVRLIQRLKREGIDRRQWPQSRHWNWAEKAASLDPGRLAALGDVRLFGITQSGEWQGVLWGEICDPRGTEHRAKVGPPGRSLVYVSYVEAAPWNWDVPPRPPDQATVQRRRYKGLGSQLMECAVRWSLQLEFRGRVGLHALPQAEAFYRQDCGMTDLGPDTAYQGMTYFEMTEEQARTFLEGKR